MLVEAAYTLALGAVNLPPAKDTPTVSPKSEASKDRSNTNDDLRSPPSCSPSPPPGFSLSTPADPAGPALESNEINSSFSGVDHSVETSVAIHLSFLMDRIWVALVTLFPVHHPTPLGLPLFQEPQSPPK
jgi:hypothetical protein